MSDLTDAALDANYFSDSAGGRERIKRQKIAGFPALLGRQTDITSSQTTSDGVVDRPVRGTAPLPSESAAGDGNTLPSDNAKNNEPRLKSRFSSK